MAFRARQLRHGFPSKEATCLSTLLKQPSYFRAAPNCPPFGAAESPAEASYYRKGAIWTIWAHFSVCLYRTQIGDLG